MPVCYERVTSIYTRIWGESFHFASFRPGETLAEGIRSSETKLADAGELGPGKFYVPDRAALFGQCARVLRSGGKYVAHDWFMRNRLDAEEQRGHIAPLCRFHGIPGPGSLSATRSTLDATGFDTLHFCAIAEDSGILRKWKLIEQRIVNGLRRYSPKLIPRTRRTLVDGGYALLDGIRANAFVIACGIAEKGEQ
ncbi:hypothetical protein [Sorangium atrum]|uniref:Methyltransferase type 11 domain-containing protein n=1 Tax=Sorangium atrum TaxID=2995308 RepID=A0ABT5CF69_9BACT|nr:hypothetical protein [Sorangium aterium]MDC0685082.1 hypothetical protein [Sorangium aterium]